MQERNSLHKIKSNKQAVYLRWPVFLWHKCQISTSQYPYNYKSKPKMDTKKNAGTHIIAVPANTQYLN